jgi:hypothetical protein
MHLTYRVLLVAAALQIASYGLASAGLVYGSVWQPDGKSAKGMTFDIFSIAGARVASATSDARGQYCVMLDNGHYRAVRGSWSARIRSITQPWQQDIKFQRDQ